ncbi:hypothetical protein ZIOFF_039551 [Zingiber officinale]|uniref:Uncharacterized protein n=1 Tax=Zingiber officinale TaxID=94328 RepID=A0A8J5GBE0_ZINOF|nr:hypothetical protein ZIOFF_039551 [Zingiber officinale]
MAQYLVDSCGFDREKATKASKLLKGIQSRQQPDSVLAFLKSYGFDDASVKKILHHSPKCLLLDVEKTLAPKFRAFEDLGFSPSDIVHLVQSNPDTTKVKHERTVPRIEFWQGLLGSKDALVKVFKNYNWVLGYSIKKRIQPNLEMLRECGSLISRVEDLGVPQTSGMFHCTLCALFVVHPKKFKMLMDMFLNFGWSQGDFVAAIQKCHNLLQRSLKHLQRKMEFLINEAGYASSYIATRPVLLTLSLERRLIPRYRILAALKSRGHCESDYKVTTYMQLSETKFVEKYIVVYKDRYPDLSELYASLKHTNASDSGLQ